MKIAIAWALIAMAQALIAIYSQGPYCCLVCVVYFEGCSETYSMPLSMNESVCKNNVDVLYCFAHCIASLYLYHSNVMLTYTSNISDKTKIPLPCLNVVLSCYLA